MEDRNGQGKRQSLVPSGEVALAQVDCLLALPPREQAGVLGEQSVLLLSPLSLVILLGVGFVEGAHVAGDAVEPADEDGQRGAVLLGEHGEQFRELAEGEVLGGQGELRLRGRLRLDTVVHDLQQVLHLLRDLHPLLLQAHYHDLNQNTFIRSKPPLLSLNLIGAIAGAVWASNQNYQGAGRRSVLHDLLRVGTEEVGGRRDLRGVDLRAGELGQVGDDDLLLDREELVEGETLLVAQPLNHLAVGLRAQQSLSVALGADEPLLRLVGLEDLAHHEDLLLVEALVEVALHAEAGVDSWLLRFAAAHVRWYLLQEADVMITRVTA